MQQDIQAFSQKSAGGFKKLQKGLTSSIIKAKTTQISPSLYGCTKKFYQTKNPTNLPTIRQTFIDNIIKLKIPPSTLLTVEAN